MMRRMMVLMGVATMLTLTAGGVWATLANANTKAAVDGCTCDTDPTCPAGCSSECPPDCTYCPALGLTAKAKGKVKKAVDCCDDPACPPGCSSACPPDCLGFIAKETKAKNQTKAKTFCPPCPFCP